MKKIYSFLVLLMATVLLFSGGCKKKNEIDLAEDGILRVTSADIDWLRTNGNAWVSGDAIGVFAFTSGEDLSLTSLYENKANIKFVTKGGNGVFSHESESITLPKNDNLDIVAYYPYSTAVTGFVYNFDNSNQGDQAKIDLLYAKAEGLNATNSNASMSFTHQLTMVQIILNTNGFELDNPVIALNDVIVNGSMSLIDGTVTTGDTAKKTSVTLTDKNTEGALVGRFILPPQVYESKKLTLTVAGKSFEAAIPNFTAVSGYRYALKVNYVKVGGDVNLGVESSIITEWNDGEALDPIDISDGETTIEVDEVIVTPAIADMTQGETLQLSYEVRPTEAADKTVTWESSKESVATVTGGKVTAIGEGIAVISATSKNGKKGTCTITVKKTNEDKSIPDVPGVNL